MLKLSQFEYSPNFQSLSAFRVLFALYLLAQFAGALPFYDDFYAASGIMPLQTLAFDTSIAGVGSLMPLLRLADSTGLSAIVQVAYPLSLVALAIGFRTRWAGAIALVLDGYLFWRNPYLVSGAEILARLLLLWSLFLPINRYWSVDAALDKQPRRRPWPALPFIALRLQIASLYFFSALFKLEGAPWRQGYALAWTLPDNLYAGTPLGLLFADRAPGLLSATGYLVVAFQLAFSYLIYSPWRNELTRAVAIVGSVAMHVSFIVFLKIGGFPYLCLIMLLLLVPDLWFDRLLHRRRERLGRIKIYYEPDCGFCEKVSLLLREFLLSPTVAVLPASADPAAFRLLTEHGSWVVIDPEGKPRLKWRAVAYVLRQNPLLAPPGYISDLPALRRPMARLYDFIGERRRTLGAVTRHVLPFRSDRPPGRHALALNGILAALALLCNVISLDQWAIDRPRQEIHSAAYRGVRSGVDEFFAVLQIRQAWALFAPVPTHWQWTYRFRAARRDSDAAIAVDWAFAAANADGAVQFNRLYWRQYFSRFDQFSDADWAALDDYLCRVAGRRAALIAAVEVSISRRPVPSPVPGGSEFTVHRRLACGGASS